MSLGLSSSRAGRCGNSFIWQQLFGLLSVQNMLIILFDEDISFI